MALKLKPDFEEAACNLGAAMANEGKWVEAAAWYGKAIQLNHDFAPAHYGLGLIFRQQGKLTEAVTSLSTVLRIDPSHAGAHDQLGMFLAGQGNLQEAVKHFESALRVRPADPALHCHLAGALNAQGKTPEAIADYRRALELNPESSEALNNLAWILAAHPEPGFRDGPEAVRLAEHACQLTQNHEAVLVGTLAAAYAESGRFSDAVATAEKARELAAGAGQTNVAQKNLEMLELYRAKKAYHETAAASQKPGS
jgi:tetratricopeptide (TPR) repeat protein